MDVNLGPSNEGSPSLRPSSGSLASSAASGSSASLAPPGDSSPPVIDEPPTFSSLAWPQAEPLDAAGGGGHREPASASDVDSLLGLASAAASSSAGGSSSSVSRASAKFPILMAKEAKPHILDNVERRSNALAGLRIICESPVFLHRLEALLAMQDAQGNTPFMAAVANRSYPAALVLFEAAQKVSKESSNDLETQKKTLMSMLYPKGSPADDSPLHVICCNDTCSFTWTGAEHINQDIFECLTCGLTDRYVYQYVQSAHATICSVLTQPLATLLIIPFRNVSIVTLLNFNY
jgi:hypothetical protein